MYSNFCFDSKELASDFGSAWSGTFVVDDDIRTYDTPVFTIYRGSTAVVIATENNGKITAVPGTTNAFEVDLPAVDTEIEPGYYDYSFAASTHPTLGSSYTYTVASGRFRVEREYPISMPGVRDPLYTLNRHDTKVKAGRDLTLGVTFDGAPPPADTEDWLYVYNTIDVVKYYNRVIEGDESWLTIPASDTVDLPPGRYSYRRAIIYPTKAEVVAKGLLWVLPEVPT